MEPWWNAGGTLVDPGGTLVEPWWNGPPLTTPKPIWAETPKLSAVGEKKTKTKTRQVPHKRPCRDVQNLWLNDKQPNALLVSQNGEPSVKQADKTLERIHIYITTDLQDKTHPVQCETGDSSNYILQPSRNPIDLLSHAARLLPNTSMLRTNAYYMASRYLAVKRMVEWRMNVDISSTSPLFTKPPPPPPRRILRIASLVGAGKCCLRLLISSYSDKWMEPILGFRLKTTQFLRVPPRDKPILGSSSPFKNKSGTHQVSVSQAMSSFEPADCYLHCFPPSLRLIPRTPPVGDPTGGP